MSWEPDSKRQNGSYASDYTAEEAVVVDKAKRVHKETTASAHRALKVRTFIWGTLNHSCGALLTQRWVSKQLFSAYPGSQCVLQDREGDSGQSHACKWSGRC